MVSGSSRCEVDIVGTEARTSLWLGQATYLRQVTCEEVTSNGPRDRQDQALQ